jgi:hypothetical protein
MAREQHKLATQGQVICERSERSMLHHLLGKLGKSEKITLISQEICERSEINAAPSSGQAGQT